MITDYFRPQTLEEALKLLAAPETRPLGGGTVLSHPVDESFTVVDLQALSLNNIHKSGNQLEIGATVPLQALLESLFAPKALKNALKLEAPLNIRTMGTVAGTLVTCDGRSPFAAVMLALDAMIVICDLSTVDGAIPIGEFLLSHNKIPHGSLITKIKIPLQTQLTFETVARSPADKPIVCCALAQWPSGHTRLVLGGWGNSPTLALDGNDASGLEEAARTAAYEATDEWATAEYRSAVAALLAKRCFESSGSNGDLQ